MMKKNKHFFLNKVKNIVYLTNRDYLMSKKIANYYRIKELVSCGFTKKFATDIINELYNN
jgi:hypothetical protein